MKTLSRVSTVVIALFIAAFVLACSEKKDWPEMDAFHMTMAEAFHPFKDSANLKPARETAVALAADAEKWATSALPDKVDNDEVKASLKKLSDDAKTFAELVKGGTPDDELGKKLTELHSEFHSIMEAYHGGGKKEHHDK